MRHSLLHRLSLLEQRHAPQPDATDAAWIRVRLEEKLLLALEADEGPEPSEDEVQRQVAELHALLRERIDTNQAARRGRR
jgi:hypothetical protein